MECFEECAHHVATGVPKEDWAEWATLLSTSEECSDDAPVSDGLTGANGGQHASSKFPANGSTDVARAPATHTIKTKQSFVGADRLRRNFLAGAGSGSDFVARGVCQSPLYQRG